MQTKTLFRQKVILVFFGLCLSGILLEVGLRIGGFTILSMQEFQNKSALKQKDSYRILCLGESTTALGGKDSFPSQLEEILNQRNIGINFRVINKGRAGMVTPVIISKVESYLDEFKPNMVVSMMGVNDLGRHMPHETLTYSKARLFLRSLRTYKLARLLWLHLLTKTKEMRSIDFKQNKQPNSIRQPANTCRLQKFFLREKFLRIVIKLNPNNVEAYLKLGGIYRLNKEYFQAKKVYLRAIEHNPDSAQLYHELGVLYGGEGDLSSAKKFLHRAIELNPNNERSYLELGRVYRLEEDFSPYEIFLHGVIEFNPYLVYVELGRIYRFYEKFSQAEEYFHKAIELRYDNYWAYTELGYTYRLQGKLLQAEEVFRKAIELDPNNCWPYAELGHVYLLQKKNHQAEEVFHKAIELNPNFTWAYTELGLIYALGGKHSQLKELQKRLSQIPSLEKDKFYGILATLYRVSGDLERAQNYYNKANQLRVREYVPTVQKSYRMLKKILDKRGIRLVCVQYPMRSVTSLKKIFEGNNHDIIFIDNEEIFQSAVAKEGYQAYFLDLFAGDFGHCTPKGNRLLAENIANAILREYFYK